MTRLRLSPHFTIEEFDCRGRPEADLPPRHVPEAAIPALRRLCVNVLEPLRARYGPCQVLSGYRYWGYNRYIGGARFSQHIYTLGPDSVAADVRFRRGTPWLWRVRARMIFGLRRGGVGYYRRSGFVHVDNRSYRSDWSGT
jgi:uncharacterized protein YcbK (DUF882 family)